MLRRCITHEEQRKMKQVMRLSFGGRNHGLTTWRRAGGGELNEKYLS
jgi:hypothetical protein